MVAAFLGQSRREGMYTDKKTFPLNDRSPHYWDKILPGEKVENLGKWTRTKIIFLGQNPISLWAILKGSTVGERLEQSRIWS